VKGLYALTNILLNNPEAVRRMERLGGWEVLRDQLRGSCPLFVGDKTSNNFNLDTNITTRRKVVFLFRALLKCTPEHHMIINFKLSYLDHDNSGMIHRQLPYLEHLESIETPWNFDIHEETRNAMQKHAIIEVLIDTLTAPIPHTSPMVGDLDEEYATVAAHLLIQYLDVRPHIHIIDNF